MKAVFLPGTVVAARYRIAGLLGRGGMGEVCRATDLTLGQAVALNFLPEATASADRAPARIPGPPGIRRFRQNTGGIRQSPLRQTHKMYGLLQVPKIRHSPL